VIGQRFSVAKRRVAMFCVALCMGLSAQMTIVVLDNLKHVFEIDHAPNGLAGYVVFHDREVPPHSHPHGDDGGPAHGHHSHDGVPSGHDHEPLTHHHYGSGMLTPWLVSAPPQLAALSVRIVVADHGVTRHPDAPAWRRDRPPKLHLERIV
jgi:hypothetical protein